MTVDLLRPRPCARIPKALADRARLDAYERTPPAERFVGLAHVGEGMNS